MAIVWFLVAAGILGFLLWAAKHLEDLQCPRCGRQTLPNGTCEHCEIADAIVSAWKAVERSRGL